MTTSSEPTSCGRCSVSEIRESDRNPILQRVRHYYNSYAKTEGQPPTWNHMARTIQRWKVSDDWTISARDRYNAIRTIYALERMERRQRQQAEREKPYNDLIRVIDLLLGDDPRDDTWEAGYCAALQHIKGEILARKEAL